MSASKSAQHYDASALRIAAVGCTKLRGDHLSRLEQQNITRRLVINMLGAGLLVLGVGLDIWAPSQHEIANLIQAIAALLVSVNVVVRGLRGFLSRPSSNYADQLVAIAVLAAAASRDYLSAALIPLFLEIGHLLEERSGLGASLSLEKLRELSTQQATRLSSEGEQIVNSDEIQTGDLLLVEPGEVIPTDGRVSYGTGFVDERSITGESSPRAVNRNDLVFAGTASLDGALRIRATSSPATSLIGSVLDVLQQLESAKLPITRLMEHAASKYLILVLVLAAFVLFLSGEVSRFVTVLVVACPCALVLAAPSAIIAAMSAATRKSILIKNAGFLERATDLDTAVLDKTGTLTKGAMQVVAIHPKNNLDPDAVLQVAASVAIASRHPASQAIICEAEKQSRDLLAVSGSEEKPGLGVQASQGERILRIGRGSWFQSLGIGDIEPHRESGVWVAEDDIVIGFIELTDEIRIETRETIETLRTLGIQRITLLTGDTEDSARRFSADLPFDAVCCEVLPEEKLNAIHDEQAQGRSVLMVGDGVNDALALSAADIGIAFGSSMNDIALGGADIAILSNDLSALPFVIDLAQRSRQTILQNIGIACSVSLLMLALAAVGVISPLTGAILHNAGAIFVIFNSARLMETAHERSNVTSGSGERPYDRMSMRGDGLSHPLHTENKE
ncbi:MAG: cation-translocating P-type ATPase [Pseudomonadota bacterium]